MRQHLVQQSLVTKQPTDRPVCLSICVLRRHCPNALCVYSYCLCAPCTPSSCLVSYEFLLNHVPRCPDVFRHGDYQEPV